MSNPKADAPDISSTMKELIGKVIRWAPVMGAPAATPDVGVTDPVETAHETCSTDPDQPFTESKASPMFGGNVVPCPVVESRVLAKADSPEKIGDTAVKIPPTESKVNTAEVASDPVMGALSRGEEVPPCDPTDEDRRQEAAYRTRLQQACDAIDFWGVLPVKPRRSTGDLADYIDWDVQYIEKLMRVSGASADACMFILDYIKKSTPSERERWARSLVRTEGQETPYLCDDDIHAILCRHEDLLIPQRRAEKLLRDARKQQAEERPNIFATYAECGFIKEQPTETQNNPTGWSSIPAKPAEPTYAEVLTEWQRENAANKAIADAGIAEAKEQTRLLTKLVSLVDDILERLPEKAGQGAMDCLALKQSGALGSKYASPLAVFRQSGKTEATHAERMKKALEACDDLIKALRVTPVMVDELQDELIAIGLSEDKAEGVVARMTADDIDHTLTVADADDVARAFRNLGWIPEL